MNVFVRQLWLTSILAALATVVTPAQAQEKGPAQNVAATTPEAVQTKAAFEAKFEEYKAAVREIEKLQAEFQTATPDRRKKLNEEVTGQIAHTQSIVNAMVEAAEAAFKAAPNTDQQITDVLTAIAKHYAIGRQVG